MEFNQKQWAAITSKDEQICVIAGAGSGKTSTAVEAIIQYQKDNPNDIINFITFTRAASEEMTERLMSRINSNNIAVSTIHVWAREQLVKLAQKYGFKIYILSEKEELEILKDLIDNHRTKVKPEILLAYVNGNKHMDVSEGYLKTLSCLEKKYIAYKEDNELYDFTDYPKYLLSKLKEYAEYITDIDALFVDEVQDVDAEQLAIFDRVFCGKKFLIGDFKQSIYQFRGADPDAFKKLNGFTYLELDINYRSHQEIIDFADAVYSNLEIKLNDESNRSPLKITDTRVCGRSHIKAARGKGSKIFLINKFGGCWELNGAQCMSLQAFSYIMKKQPWILCRTNREVKTILQMGYSRVSTVHQAKGLEYDDVVVIESHIDSLEDINIAYVAITRCKNDLLVSDFVQFYNFMKQWVKN